MISFADFFSDKYKEEFAKRNLKVGSVIKVYVSDTHPPKEKRLILVGISYDKIYFASIFLNSEINVNVFPTPTLKNLNVEFKSAEKEYLDHDSFADCSQIQKRKTDWLMEIISKDPSKILGELNNEDLELVLAKIKSAPTISPALKKTFGLYL
jgi:hypothetical protein